jgi:transposase
LRNFKPGIKIEVLVPDFKGRRESIACVLDSQPDVFAHNIETVPRLYGTLRPQNAAACGAGAAATGKGSALGSVLARQQASSLSVAGFCPREQLSEATLRYWVKANREGKLKEVGNQQRPLTEVEMELARVKRELAEVRMERDILKKAAAYFAKESLPGTRS